MHRSNIIEKQLSNKIMNPIGKKNHPKKIQKLVIIIARIKYIISTLITKRANFKNNFNPSVIGVSNPNKNNAGPILICTIASTLLSQRLTNPDKIRITKIKIIIIIHISK